MTFSDLIYVFIFYIRFFYTGQVLKGVEVMQADPSKILKNTGEVSEDILHSNLILFLKLSDYYRVAELKEIVEDGMIAKLDEENYEEFLVAANRYGGERVKAAVTNFLSQNPAVLQEHLTDFANKF